MNVTFHGAAPDTTNMGVSALFATMVSGIARRIPEANIRVFDGSLGSRRVECRLDDGDPVSLEYLGVRRGRRLYRPENLAHIQTLAKLGSLASYLNPALAAIDGSDCFLDVSGGDSFTDMYPDERIELIGGMKELVIERGTPLVLLPQTYGPFDQSRSRAERIVRSSRACWARDARSYEYLKGLLGDAFDPSRHHQGVDMAFGLHVRRPERLPDFLGGGQTRSSGLIGLNISGLMYNDPEVARTKYGFIANYQNLVDDFIQWVLDETKARIILVPHVMAPPPAKESDLNACLQVVSRFDGSSNGRLAISPTDYDQNEVKWVISQCDWFCGTRMHATIAGLSTCTPTATVSYSDKALGVFETCSQGSEVFDPRSLDTGTVLSSVIDSYRRRDEIRDELDREIPGVKATAEKQMDDIADVIRQCAGPGDP